MTTRRANRLGPIKKERRNFTTILPIEIIEKFVLQQHLLSSPFSRNLISPRVHFLLPSPFSRNHFNEWTNPLMAHSTGGWYKTDWDVLSSETRGKKMGSSSCFSPLSSHSPLDILTLINFLPLRFLTHKWSILFPLQQCSCCEHYVTIPTLEYAKEEGEKYDRQGMHPPSK